MDISRTLHSKRVALDRARAEVRSLEEQVAYWENAETMSKKVSVFEQMAEQEVIQKLPLVNEAKPTDSIATAPPFTVKGVDVFATSRVRNKKGSVRSTILSALNHETNTTLDEIEAALVARVNSPVTRASLRTQMMNLKNDGYVVSDAPGVFRLAKKGEAATDSQSVTASSATGLSGSN